jgi:hypothetical protein
MGASIPVRLADLALCESLPTKMPGMQAIFEDGNLEVAAAEGPLSRDASQFVMLRCAHHGRWKPVAVERSSMARRLGPFIRGFPLIAASSAGERCRFLMQQPQVGDTSQVFFRAAGGQDTHMGYLLFVGDTLCERACLTGTPNRWERMEMRPTRFKETWCFHLVNHRSQLPVCFAVNGAGGWSRGTFVRRQATHPGEMVVFSLQDFNEGLAFDEKEASSPVLNTSFLSTDGGPSARNVIDSMARATQSTLARAWALPRLLIQGPNLIGHLGAGLFSSATPRSSLQPSAERRSVALANQAAGLPHSQKKVDKLHPAFELLEGSVADADSGEPLETGTVIRGSRRVEKVRFKTTLDLTDLVRIVKVSVAFMTFTDKSVMGSFVAQQEPHEFAFPEKLVPRTSPSGTYRIQLSFVAANVDEPLYVESSRFRMV